MYKRSLIWLRRSLRIQENKVIEAALKNSEQVQICFIFDSSILSHFPNQKDRRLSFIANHIEWMNEELSPHNASVSILYGNADEEMLGFVQANQIDHVYCDMDFEPSSISRDKKIEESLGAINVGLTAILDHLLIHPTTIKKQDNTPYRVFTPFMKHFRSMLNNISIEDIKYTLDNKFIPSNHNIHKTQMLERAGYTYVEDSIWHPSKADFTLEKFIQEKLNQYHLNRNLLFGDHTSTISPYLRFGALSIRKCFRNALLSEIHPSYVNELIWREFYAYIMFCFPDTIKFEFQEKYREKINWQYDEKLLMKFMNGNTGYPVVDAAIRQLLTTGWMHNRARMIVASFFTKNLFFNWRIGEEFFGQYLMDYDLASNVGGWQWTASTGTDAQPYFRVFNPVNQGRDFDKTGEYIKTFIPELRSVEVSDIHDPEILKVKYPGLQYPYPIVDYKKSREYAIHTFKEIT